MNGAREQPADILMISKNPKKVGHRLTHRPTDIGQNINIGIILPLAFTMIRIEIYIFTLKGLTGGSPHRCLMRYRWGLATMSALRWMSINPISITMSTNTNILQANSRKKVRRKTNGQVDIYESSPDDLPLTDGSVYQGSGVWDQGLRTVDQGPGLARRCSMAGSGIRALSPPAEYHPCKMEKPPLKNPCNIDEGLFLPR